jgi:hypothetical protein
VTQISNADKQARFRKKEVLKRHADDVYRHWEQSTNRWRIPTRTPEDARHAIDKAVELPSGWTDEDFEHALRRLGQCKLDLDLSVDQIANDVNGDWETHAKEFMTTHDPAKFQADNKAGIQKAQALASHLISALKLSDCNDADQAAAVMELLRFVGRSLTNDRNVRCSHATAMCLATVGPQYDRPEWFADKLAKAIGQNIHGKLAQEVGQHLIKSSSLPF